MKTPPGLQPLIDDDVIDEVTVYMLRAGAQCCAMVNRDMGQRSL